MVNPYQAPASVDPAPDPARAADTGASRWSRLWAALLDSLVNIALIVPLQYFGGVYRDFPKTPPQPPSESLLWAAAGFAIWLALNGVFLARNAQTVGKKALGIQVVNVIDGKPATFSRLVLWRELPLYLFMQIPYIGVPCTILSLLWIFRKDRRCVHDHIAGTRVVDFVKKVAPV